MQCNIPGLMIRSSRSASRPPKCQREHRHKASVHRRISPLSFFDDGYLARRSHDNSNIVMSTLKLYERLADELAKAIADGRLLGAAHQRRVFRVGHRQQWRPGNPVRTVPFHGQLSSVKHNLCSGLPLGSLQCQGRAPQVRATQHRGPVLRRTAVGELLPARECVGQPRGPIQWLLRGTWVNSLCTRIGSRRGIALRPTCAGFASHSCR